jgi:hypothetical protein
VVQWNEKNSGQNKDVRQMKAKLQHERIAWGNASKNRKLGSSIIYFFAVNSFAVGC